MKKLELIKIIGNSLVTFLTLGSYIWYLITIFVTGAYKNETTYAYYTVLSNLYLGLAFLAYLIAYLVCRKKGIIVPRVFYVIKYTAVSSILLTFFVVVFFLTPKATSYDLLYGNFSLFMHVINPLTAAVVFIVFEHDYELKWPEAFFVPIFTVIYGIFYFTNVVILGKPEFDLYNFITTWDSGVPEIHKENAISTILILLTVIVFLGFLVLFLNKLTKKVDEKIN